MRKTLAIFEKEFKTFFYSPLAYVIIAIFTLITGYLFYNVLSWFVEQSFMMTMQAQQYRQAPPKFNVNLHLIRGYFGTLAFISLFILPTITMRLFAEEKKQGTLELLYTTPITELQVVIGKYLAGLALYIILLIPTMFFMAILFVYGDPEFLPVLSGYIGLTLLSSTFIALGLFISTLTENQIIAAIGGFALSLLLWIIGWGATFAGGTIKPVLEYLSILVHFEDFAQGVIDSTHVAYYLLFTAFGLYLSFKSIESVKWRA